MNKRMGANKRIKKQEIKSGFIKVVFVFIKKLLIVSVVGVIVAIGVMCVVSGGRKIKQYVDEKQVFNVDEIVVFGASSDDSLYISKVVFDNNRTATFGFNSTKVNKEICKCGRFEKVKIKRKMPSVVEVTVKERRPVAFVNIGKIRFVDKKGNLWSVKHKAYNSIPLISGLKDTVYGGCNVLTKDSVKKMNAFFDCMKNKLPIMHDDVSQVSFTSNGKVIVNLESSNVTVKINSSEIEMDIRRMWQVLSTIRDEKRNEPAVIDLSCGSLAFVRN